MVCLLFDLKSLFQHWLVSYFIMTAMSNVVVSTPAEISKINYSAYTHNGYHYHEALKIY